MSKDIYDFSDLDAILAEFRSGDEAEETPIQDETVSPAPEAEYSTTADPASGEAAPFAPVSSEATMRYDLPPIYAREEEDERKASQKSRFTKAKEEAEAPAVEAAPEAAPKKRRGFGRKPKKEQAVSDAPKQAAEDKPKKAPKPPRVYVKKRIPWILRALMTLVFLAASLVVLVWALMFLHPASGTLNAFSASDTKLRLSGKLDEYVNNAAADALGDLTYIKKVYTLQESATVAPAPDPNAFGTTYDPADITALIDKAAILLDGQKMTFDPTADFVPDEPIRYYYDDTILVIAWKEYIEQRCCTFAEVKVAHGSQLRRKLAEDSYSSSVQLYASDMANASNAVVAMNGDFYAFRDLGITAYQRKLYRNNPAQVDSCFFTASGDMIFSRAGELMGEGEAERFIEANDVVFAVAFGPVLVDNGELQYCSGYPIGEVNTEYSRSCIAMTDELHYLLMTINHTPDARPRATINELARIIYSKNVWKAYTLDGGQTAEIIMMGGPINHVDFGVERAVSDIIYFATAIPEEVRR